MVFGYVELNDTCVVLGWLWQEGEPLPARDRGLARGCASAMLAEGMRPRGCHGS